MLKLNRLKEAPKNFLIAIFVFFISSFTSLFAVHDYINALYLTTYFYGAQRCGNTASWCHGACHVKDGLAPGGTGIDLTGGWHDCGDHVTFGQTAPYAAGALLEGYLLRPASYKDNYSQANSAPPSNGIPDVLDEAKIMTDLLIKCITGGRFYYQKGNGDYDHKHMDEPRDFSLNYTITEGGETDGGRPLSYVTSGGSNVCGDAAAALALMAIAYQPYDAAYATTCFTKAKEVFAIGDTSPGTVNGGSYYGAANYQDDMAWGGATIYRASVARGAAEATYLTKATTYIAGGQGAGSWPLCYDHTEFLAHYNLYKINALASDLTWMVNDVTYYKNNMVTCGIGSYAHVTSWGSLRYAGNMAFAACLLNSINSDATAYNFAKSNIDFILGTHGDIAGTPNCPQGRSFVVGYTNPDYAAQGSVLHPHHRAAFGKTKAGGADTLWQTENTTPGSVAYAYVLKGALVGGPQANCGTYNDRIDDYTSNEVGVDYNAGLVGAIAYIISVVNPSTPTYTITPNLSFTRTWTPSITPTWTQSPIPPPTNKLNLQVMTQGSSDNCTSQTFGFQYQITNWETTVVNTSNMAIKIWLDTTDTIAGSIYNARKYDNTGTDQGTITVTIAEGAGAGCAGATKSVLLTVAATDIPANGGYLMIQGALNRASYSTPFDLGCNDYTKMLATWTTYQNNPTQTLWQGTNLVCEYISNTTQDASTGLHPCTGANGCGAPTTPTNTPVAPTNTRTRTATPTYTRTPTFTYTFTRTNTIPAPTSTFTQTYTRTATSTYTRTPSSTPTYTFTRTNTVSVPTSTFTMTFTYTGTRTATPTFTNTSTPVPSATFTVTATSTGTRTASQTYTGTPTPTHTRTNTIVITNTFTPSYTTTASPTFTRTSTIVITNTYTPTYTRTPTPTSTRTSTIVITNTFTPSYTTTASPTFTRTNTIVITSTFTPTYTRTPTATQSFTPTSTRTATPTYTYTASPLPTSTFTGTRTASPTFTATFTITASPTFTSSRTSTATPTFTRTATNTATFSQTPTVTMSWTPGYGTHTDTPTITVSPTRTPSFTPTPTFTPSPTGTFTFTRTMTFTSTFTRTYTQSFTPTSTRTPTLVSSPSNTPTFTATRTFTPTAVDTPADTYTATSTTTRTITPSLTFTQTFTGTATYTTTRSATPTFTRTVTPTATRTATATYTASPSNTYTRTRTATLTVTNTDTITPTNSVSPTFTPFAGSATNTPTITRTYTVTMTSTELDTDTATPTPTSTDVDTATPTFTSTEEDSATPTPADTDTPVSTQVNTPVDTAVPTNTNTPQPTQVNTLAPTAGASATNTSTAAPSFTFTATATRTATLVIPTSTSSAVPTATGTSNIVPTSTVSSSVTPSPTLNAPNTPLPTNTNTGTAIPDTSTPTPTATDTPAATATFTPVTVPTTQHISITDVLPCPNPYNPEKGDLTVILDITRDASKMEFNIFTAGLRKVRHYQVEGNILAGRSSFTINNSLFRGLSQGVYYYVIIVKGDNNETADSRIDKIFIIH